MRADWWRHNASTALTWIPDVERAIPKRGLKAAAARARFVSWEEALLTNVDHASDHHILVIGGSSGSLGPLRSILSTLPEGVPATVLVALHLAPELSDPARLLTGHTHWTVKLAEEGARLATGHIYIAPSNRHLALQGDVTRVFYGPRESKSEAKRS